MVRSVTRAHLRVRGADTGAMELRPKLLGSSRRARGRHVATRAGTRAHLRVRGADPSGVLCFRAFQSVGKRLPSLSLPRRGVRGRELLSDGVQGARAVLGDGGVLSRETGSSLDAARRGRAVLATRRQRVTGRDGGEQRRSREDAAGRHAIGIGIGPTPSTRRPVSSDRRYIAPTCRLMTSLTRARS